MPVALPNTDTFKDVIHKSFATGAEQLVHRCSTKYVLNLLCKPVIPITQFIL